MLYAHRNSNSKGNTVLIKQLFACDVKTTYADSRSRFLLTEIKADEKNLAIYSIYAPTINDLTFLAPFFKS